MEQVIRQSPIPKEGRRIVTVKVEARILGLGSGVSGVILCYTTNKGAHCGISKNVYRYDTAIWFSGSKTTTLSYKVVIANVSLKGVSVSAHAKCTLRSSAYLKIILNCFKNQHSSNSNPMKYDNSMRV